MATTTTTTEGKPTVLIVGAGLGGLMLGALLERIDIPYVIFERTSSIKSLGKGPPHVSETVNLTITFMNELPDLIHFLTSSRRLLILFLVCL